MPDSPLGNGHSRLPPRPPSGSSPRFRALSLSDLPAAAALLSRAFFPDPLTAYLIPYETARQVALPRLYAISLRLAIRCGTVVVPRGPLTAVAAWLPPGAAVTAADVEAVDGREAIGVLGPRGSARLEEITAAFASTRERLLPAPHWYLSILASAPEHQRGGIGGALLASLFALAAGDPGAGTVYLETTNPANLPFYESHGFTVVETARTPGGLTYWPMLRPPP